MPESQSKHLEQQQEIFHPSGDLLQDLRMLSAFMGTLYYSKESAVAEDPEKLLALIRKTVATFDRLCPPFLKMETAQGSQYYVLPSGVGMRYRANLDLDLQIDPPFMTVGYITPKFSKKLVEFLSRVNSSPKTGQILSRDGELVYGAVADGNSASITLEIPDIQQEPQIGLMPFQIRRENDDTVTIRHEEGKATIIGTKTSGNLHLSPFVRDHIGHPITKIY